MYQPGGLVVFVLTPRAFTNITYPVNGVPRGMSNAVQFHDEVMLEATESWYQAPILGERSKILQCI